MPAFEDFRRESYPHQYKGRIKVDTLVGGTPSDPKVAEGWIKTKMGQTSEAALQQLVAETMVERGITDPQEAVKIANEFKNLNGFKRDPERGLYIEGRQLKAALKEAANITVGAGKIKGRGWGTTNKGLLAFFAEHIFVEQKRLHLVDEAGNPIMEPTTINQRFVHTWKGTGIQYEEQVENAVFEFDVLADYEFSEKEWALFWLTGEKNGIGATRSMGYGTYTVEHWEKVSARKVRAI